MEFLVKSKKVLALIVWSTLFTGLCASAEPQSLKLPKAPGYALSAGVYGALVDIIQTSYESIAKGKLNKIRQRQQKMAHRQTKLQKMIDNKSSKLPANAEERIAKLSTRIAQEEATYAAQEAKYRKVINGMAWVPAALHGAHDVMSPTSVGNYTSHLVRGTGPAGHLLGAYAKKDAQIGRHTALRIILSLLRMGLLSQRGLGLLTMSGDRKMGAALHGLTALQTLLATRGAKNKKARWGAVGAQLLNAGLALDQRAYLNPIALNLVEKQEERSVQKSTLTRMQRLRLGEAGLSGTQHDPAIYRFLEDKLRMRPVGKTHHIYEVLGINEKSSQEEIRKAYQKFSLKYSPDKGPSDEVKARGQLTARVNTFMKSIAPSKDALCGYKEYGDAIMSAEGEYLFDDTISPWTGVKRVGDQLMRKAKSTRGAPVFADTIQPLTTQVYRIIGYLSRPDDGEFTLNGVTFAQLPSRVADSEDSKVSKVVTSFKELARAAAQMAAIVQRWGAAQSSIKEEQRQEYQRASSSYSVKWQQVQRSLDQVSDKTPFADLNKAVGALAQEFSKLYKAVIDKVGFDASLNQ